MTDAEAADHPRDLDEHQQAQVMHGLDKALERRPAPPDDAPPPDVHSIAARRFAVIIDESTNAALKAIGDQEDELRELRAVITRRRDALNNAAVEHAKFCGDAMKAKDIMTHAVQSLRDQFANGQPLTVRLVPNGKAS